MIPVLRFAAAVPVALGLAACAFDPPPDDSETAGGEGQPPARVEEVTVTGSPEPAPHPPRLAYDADSAAMRAPRAPRVPIDRESYTHFEDNPVKLASETPVSTFSIDVDTAAYANVRRFLTHGALPRPDAVRIEELINYFDYGYPEPEDGQPFAVHTEVGPSPWHAGRHLLHIGIKADAISRDALPGANLVFLVDVSGSMRSPDKLGLLKTSLTLLSRQLRAEDRISIAVYAGAAGVVLEPTAGDEHAKVTAALAQLSAGGSTNGGAGIELAYALAEQSFIDGGINRVVLATDGDFNVGTVDRHALEALIEAKRASGVSLTVLGFGTGNYNDALMQKLAQIGNGNAAYIDTFNEARKVLVDELSATLATVARDVKIQVEFNPAVVAEYRLIGYQTRHLEREDFNNDKVDAGDIGAGHTVTALYALTLVGSDAALVDALRYGDDPAPATGRTDEVAFVRLRYKTPGDDVSRLIERPVLRADIVETVTGTSSDFRFGAAVAGFGQLLRGGRYTQDFTFDDVLQLASAARGEDPFGYRGEFLSLVRTAAALTGHEVSQR